MDDLLYTSAQVEEIAATAAAMAARQAVSSVLHLENIINCAGSGEGTDMKERRKVVIGNNDDGSPVYKTLNADSQDEMNVKIVKTLLNSGRMYEILPELRPKPVVCLKEYAYQWLKRKRKLKQTTVVNYTKYLEEYIIPALGNKELNDISPLDVQEMLDTHKKLSHSTLKNMKEILSQILKYAINDGIIVKNPCSDMDIDIPSDKKKIRDALPLEDFKDILSNLGRLQLEDRRFLGLCMYTAMRRGEVLGLKWEDIHDGFIHVCRNVTHPQQNTPVITTPKTEAGKRTIPVAPALNEILAHTDEKGFILGGSNPFSLSAYRNMWERINKTIDMHGATPHVLRHSYLTYAIGETTDYKTVQGISGHADLSTLLNTYAHFQQTKMQSLTSRLSDLFG